MEKWEFRDTMERMMVVVELGVMLCVAEDFKLGVCTISKLAILWMKHEADCPNRL